MSLRIQTNIAAFDAERNLSATSMRMQKSMARLSSGYRINTAADDAAGLAIRSAACTRRAATCRTRSRSCRPLRVS
jgi:hypothetical protein